MKDYLLGERDIPTIRFVRLGLAPYEFNYLSVICSKLGHVDVPNPRKPDPPHRTGSGWRHQSRLQCLGLASACPRKMLRITYVTSIGRRISAGFSVGPPFSLPAA